ncbi:NAD(P)-dependent oxidoreductase [Enterococcus sp. LJL99]
MNIGIIGSNGKLGTLVAKKLSEKGIDFTQIIRDVFKNDGKHTYLIKDIANLSKEDIEKFDCVISCYKSSSNSPKEVVTVTEHLIEIFTNTSTRLIFAGGSGVLKDSDSGVPLAESEVLQRKVKMNQAYVKGAQEQLKAFNLLNGCSTFDWTYMAPAAILDYEEKETGSYELTGADLGFNHLGQSIIGYSDYASAIVAELNRMDRNKVVGVVSI